MKHLAIAAAACAVLVACGATETAEPVVEAVVESAEEKTEAPTTEIGEAETLPAVAKLVEPETAPVGPVKIEVNSDQVTAVANIEGAIFAFAPKLGEELKSDATSAFEKAKSIAAEDAGEDYFMPHDYQYDYTKSASAGDIISVEYFEMMFTGGAHPNYIVGGIIHDRASGEDLSPQTLLTEEGKPEMKVLLMEELAKMKLERMSMEPQDLPILREEVADVFPKEIDFWFGGVTLLPSEEAGKFGGLMVHYSPYDVGAYAEGSYEILVKAADLDGMLAEPYAALFGGEPVIEETEEP